MATSNSETDALFRLPLNEFTAARNALVAKLKKAGRADDAERVKGLAKPPLSAWAVNQLYWKNREPFERLLAAGDRLRSAQASQLRGKGGELREPLEARRVALSELSQATTALLREAGHTPSPDLMRRITTTLEALATYGSREATAAAGFEDRAAAFGFARVRGAGIARALRAFGWFGSFSSRARSQPCAALRIAAWTNGRGRQEAES